MRPEDQGLLPRRPGLVLLVLRADARRAVRRLRREPDCLLSDRAGRPRCAKCPDEDDRDPVTVIHGLVAVLDPGAGRELVAGAVRRSAPQPAYQRRLAWALEASPALLTGDGHLAPLRAIPRFTEMLCDAGIAGVVRPSCGHCGRTVRIDKPLDGVRACRRCHARSRAVPCGRCGATRDPVTRDEQGQPVCANCFTAAPENLETCTGCGRVRPVDRRTADGPLCARCPPLAVMTCAVCGREAPCGISRTTGKPWCPACQRRRARCSACGRHDAIASGTLDRPLCAGCAPPPPWAGCPVCSDPDHPSPGQCARCLVNARLTELMGPGDGSLPPGLQALRREIAGAEHIITATRWLSKPSVAPVLSGLADGTIPLTHQALDELPRRPALDHLRQTLVAVGALPFRDEEMIRLEAYLHGLLDAQDDPERRRLLHRYLIWHLVRRMRSRNNGKPATRQQALLTRRLARGAIVFLDWLDTAGLTLGTCRQADIDQWLASGQAATAKKPDGSSAGRTPTGSPPAIFPPPPGGPGPLPSSTARAAGTPPASSCTTTNSSPRTASPGCSSCSTPRASPRSAA